jgi:integrase
MPFKADQTRRIRMTTATIASLPAPEKAVIYWDRDMPGLGLKITPTGTKTFIARYRNRDRVDRQMSLGDPAHWSIAQVRAHVRDLRRKVDQGEDPLADRQAYHAAPTVADAVTRFKAEMLAPLRPSTVADYVSILDQIVVPAIGKIKLASLKHDDIAKLHRTYGAKHPYRANRIVALMSRVLNCAIRWEWITTNVARGVERFPELARERYLTPNEIAKLSEGLTAHPDKPAADLIRLLLLTGCRRGEALHARWSQFSDLDSDSGAVWTKPASTTKQRKLHRTPISSQAVALLREIRATAIGPLLFPTVPLKALQRAWRQVCRAAEIDGVRMHDCRHSFASIAVSAGLSLPVIGSLLGHSKIATTQRYSHLYDATLRDAAERVGSVVVPLRPRDRRAS